MRNLKTDSRNLTLRNVTLNKVQFNHETTKKICIKLFSKSTFSESLSYFSSSNFFKFKRAFSETANFKNVTLKFSKKIDLKARFSM